MMLMCPVTLCSVLLFVGTVTGKYSATCRSQPVSAAEGDDVTLQCLLHPPVNLSAYTLDWSRLDIKELGEVHVYRSKRDDPTAQMVRYKNRTTLNHEELSRGIVTLQISSVQPSDSGPYKCYIPKLKAGCTINLTVVEENQQSTTGPPEEDEPNNPNVGNRNAARPHNVTAAVVTLYVLVVLVLIQICMKRLRGRTEQHLETVSDGSERKIMSV
ncbi:butyrophilin subfamily 2 member A2-like [Morone saxatilis]|uniref:butyrophilin subfamily 2 member A2-like n=1 Tax=Morone saxatilis TaxID=34816 RepID=UPI0015E23965|nr:butyrophilin subfamily 2 member A2-like [Morone saxatilis]